MRHTDIAIVGGGLAGSLAAAMLGRGGFDTILIDPHSVYPADFRCEKLDGPQVEVLRKTGIADPVLAAATHDGESWVARAGRLVEKRPGDQHGIYYDTLVNTVRAQIPNCVRFAATKVVNVSTSADRQILTLASGESLSARIVVLANGLNTGFRERLGMSREIKSPCHSIAIGFELKPAGRETFAFPALTYYPDEPQTRIAYLTLFPIAAGMRANLMVYRDLHDPWLQKFRASPHETLFASMRGLRKITGDVEISGFIKIRPTDLYVTRDYQQPGLVLVGDAFATSCPAAGTGAAKVLTDVERLCNVYIPRWLATGGMQTEKITQFYDDPVKRACDGNSQSKAYHLRSLSTKSGPTWWARRRARFVARLGAGFMRKIYGLSRVGSHPLPPGTLQGAIADR